MTAAYRLTGRLEAGDLAELYQGSQEESGDEVVVKLFHSKTSDPAYARALAETSHVLNPLSHAGIVRDVDIGFVKQRLAVVREHMDGYTLGTALHRLHGKEVLLPSAVALYLVIHLLETVQKAHEAGVVHGAITPGNLLMSREGVPGICDFGALRALMAVPELKRGFATRGRSAYRAPEVGRGDEPSAVSDVYSLGAIAYELLTLREAVVSNGGLSTRSGGLPTPSRLDRRLNTRLDPIILRALEPLPSRRFRSASDFASGLRNFLSANGGMPGQDDLRRFVSELMPTEVTLLAVGSLPFTEPFTLTPISGAEISQVHAQPLDGSVVARSPFSRSFTEEEVEAISSDMAPVAAEFRPEQWTPSEEKTAPDGPSEEVPWSEEMVTRTRGADEEPALAATHIRPAVDEEPALPPTHVRPASSAPSEESTQTRPIRLEPFASPESTRTQPIRLEPSASSESTQQIRPEPSASSEPTRTRQVRTELYAPLQPTRAGQQAPVPEQEVTEPSSAGPLERGWEAPPGAPTPRARRAQLLPQGVTPSRDGTSVGRNPRLKWAEDEPPRPKQPTKGRTGIRTSLPPDPPSRPSPDPPSRPPPSLVRPPPAEESTHRHVSKERPEIPMPPPTSEDMPAVAPRRRIFTEERILQAFARRRNQALGVVVAIALVGLFAFALSVWRSGDSASQPDAEPGTIALVPRPVGPDTARPHPERPPVASAPDERQEEAPESSSRPDANSAFITLRTNVPARVFIDGTLIHRRAPLYKYPVKAGTRTIVVEAEGTQERYEFSLRFDRGQHRTIDQQFESIPRR
jgi:eukaryotic-like serine/threonine-protein kinase